MLFRQRHQPGFVQRVRQAVWPKSGWRRASSYFMKRVLRLSGSPHAIAAGFAAGVFASFTPFIGFHFVIGFIVAFLIGGNMLAAAFGTAVGNPITFPLIWFSTYEVGSFILGTNHSNVSYDTLKDSIGELPLEAIVPLLQPMIAGALPLGIVFGALFYAIVWKGVRAYQRARRMRLATRRRAADGGVGVQESG